MNMYTELVFDRPVDPKKHYISPGGFEIEFVGGKSIQFDFHDSYGNVSKENPTKIDFELCYLDTDAFPESKELENLLLSDKIKSIIEFFVYTGEDDDPEINFKKIELVEFDLDGETVEVEQDLIDRYNKTLEEEVA